VQVILKESLNTPVDPLKLSSKLAKSFDADERRWILEWAGLQTKIFEKFPGTTPLLCDRLALEQATGIEIGSWKSRIWPAGSKVLDLCCGMGGDSFYLPPGIEVTGIDLDPMRICMYEENTARLGTPRKAILANALAPTIRADFFQIDPARRADLQGNQRRIPDLTPNWKEIESIMPHYSGGAVKLPPGFPLDQLPSTASITYLGSFQDCRECLVSVGSLASKDPKVRAVLVPGGQCFDADRSEVESFRLQTSSLGKYLFEPCATLVRSHLFPIYANPRGLWQIDDQIAYLSGNTPLPADPWLTGYEVLDFCPLGFDRVRAMLKFFGIKPIALKKRGVEVDPVAELKRLGSFGDRPGIIFYTRAQNQKIAVLTCNPEKK
jgi:SAM-dependent methyltransferase